MLGKAVTRAVQWVKPVVKKHAQIAGKTALKRVPSLILAQNKEKAAKDLVKSIGKKAISGVASDVLSQVASSGGKPRRRFGNNVRVSKKKGRRYRVLARKI